MLDKYGNREMTLILHVPGVVPLCRLAWLVRCEHGDRQRLLRGALVRQFDIAHPHKPEPRAVLMSNIELGLWSFRSCWR